MSASIAKREDDSQHQDVQTSEAGIDGYLLWEDIRPNRDTKESGDKENEVMKLVIQHLSAVTLAGEELGPWPETSPRLLSDLMGRKWSEVRTRFLDFQRNVGDRKAVRKLPSPAMASEMKRGIQKIRSHLIEAVTELVRGPGLYPWVEPGAQGRSPMQVATDLLKEEAFIRKDHDDVHSAPFLNPAIYHCLARCFYGAGNRGLARSKETNQYFHTRNSMGELVAHCSGTQVAFVCTVLEHRIRSRLSARLGEKKSEKRLEIGASSQSFDKFYNAWNDQIEARRTKLSAKLAAMAQDIAGPVCVEQTQTEEISNDFAHRLDDLDDFPAPTNRLAVQDHARLTCTQAGDRLGAGNKRPNPDTSGVVNDTGSKRRKIKGFSSKHF
ncbi:hypothetical protein V8E54_004285 [Elaphomyces granulatus]